jgi:hypothetical protein
MPLLIGIFLAFIVGLSASGVGFDRERGFYPVVTIVIASYYALFAVMGASTHELVLESIFAVVLGLGGARGFKWSLWLVVGALVAHGGFDLIHSAIISNPGIPNWWPQFCLAYDFVAAGYLAWLLTSGRLRSSI